MSYGFLFDYAAKGVVTIPSGSTGSDEQELKLKVNGRLTAGVTKSVAEIYTDGLNCLFGNVFGWNSTAGVGTKREVTQIVYDQQ